jgi:uncharacterized repeat protein (TIGR01451 family)
MAPLISCLAALCAGWQSTAIAQVPDLTISKTHVGNFTQSQNAATYTITVSNVGAGAAQAGNSVLVTDTMPPAGLTATSISGSGWTCTQPSGPCTRDFGNTALAAGASYPVLTLTVNVAPNAPAMVTNSVTVSGGGELNTTNNAASDPTTIGPGPDLTITKTHVGNFTQSQNAATYTITVSNVGAGAAQAGNSVLVTDTMPPAGLTATSISGSGWTCTQPSGPCTRDFGNTALAAGASYPPLTLTVNVAPNAPAMVTNSVTVSGGGELNTTNNAASDPTIVIGPTLDIDVSNTATKYDALTDGVLAIRYMLGVTGPALTAGALGGTATRTDPTVIKAYLDAKRSAYDIDGDGVVEATTDGLLILRYLFGLRGDLLITDAFVAGAPRDTAELIESYLATLTP